MPTLKSVIVGPSTAADPLVTVVPSHQKKVLTFVSYNPSPIFLRHLTQLDIDHNSIIPSYFNDKIILVHLAFILTPQLGEHALKKIALHYLDDDAETDAKIDVVTNQEMADDMGNQEIVEDEK